MKLLVVALSLTVLSACNAQVKTPQSIQVLEFGTFKRLSSDLDVPAPGTITGTRHSVSKVALIESTTNVAARVGTSFGFRVATLGESAGTVVQCTAKCTHPRLTDPATGHSSEVEEWDASGLVGQEGFIGFTFDNTWELVYGSWTIQLFMDSKLVFEKSFNVYSPAKN